jgi:hypothetical protein
LIETPIYSSTRSRRFMPLPPLPLPRWGEGKGEDAEGYSDRFVK